MTEADVLCVGHASYDLVFAVPRHPNLDEKIVADAFLGCGGGPAANAAIASAKFGSATGFVGYLGSDSFGDLHLGELKAAGVDTRWLVRGTAPTPLSAVLVKPDGQRALVNYRGATVPLSVDAIDLGPFRARAILFDGHEPDLSIALADQARVGNIPTVLDAGSLHRGTEALMSRVTYLVCSEKFGTQATALEDSSDALIRLAERAPWVVITLGERGLIWRHGQESGSMPAYPVEAVDTTGAGDVFHGVFTAALAQGFEWEAMLSLASAAGALSCQVMGARPGVPSREQIERWVGVGL